MAQVAYDLIGYSLNEAKFINKQKENTYIGISVIADYFNKDNNEYSIIIRVTSDFADEESYFVFQASYTINDLNYYNSLDKNMRKSIFFSTVFPFIREKIYSITSGSVPGLLIPTIDVRLINFDKELRLIKQNL